MKQRKEQNYLKNNNYFVEWGDIGKGEKGQVEIHVGIAVT